MSFESDSICFDIEPFVAAMENDRETMAECGAVACNGGMLVETRDESLSDVCAERTSGYSSNSPVAVEAPDAPHLIKTAESLYWERLPVGNVERLSLGSISECSSSWDLESPSVEVKELGTLSETAESDTDSVCASPAVEANPLLSTFRLSVCSLRSAFTYLDNTGISYSYRSDDPLPSNLC